MLQEAIITNIREDGLAEVVVERLGACGGDCNGCEGCKYEHLMKSVVLNPINAHRGQKVYIETPTGKVVWGAMAIYILPLVMLIFGYILATALSFTEGLCVAVSLAFAALGALIAVMISRRTHAKDPVPTKIVSVIYDE